MHFTAAAATELQGLSSPTLPSPLLRGGEGSLDFLNEEFDQEAIDIPLLHSKGCVVAVVAVPL